ncbi:serine hydrolase domain-containing protein [Undibacterium sp. TJN19]|uniref:serine hydrolase domain-containing protein n=1 Tax=Undibacterium sp. TJN19 TaxID=3413055 RepID=UPI003BF375E2
MSSHHLAPETLTLETPVQKKSRSALLNKTNILACFLAATLSPLATFAASIPLPSVKSLAGECDAVLKDTPADGPGTVVLLARRGELICTAARGMADVELQQALKPEHRLRIGSISKQFTAAALLKLVDQGKARIEDPLSTYIPDFPNGGNITLLQLLNHTSGIASITSVPGFDENTQRMDKTSKELMKLITDLPTDFAPGSAWRYSNSGYIVLSAVIEKITGKSWHQALDELLFKPLHLKETTYEDPAQIWPGLVRGYRKDNQGRISPAAPISMTVPQGAGALISTAKDLWQWNEALHGGRVLSPASYKQMITAQGAAIKDNYGFGIGARPVRTQTAIWHNGGINGFVSDLYYLPESGTTVVQLNNLEARVQAYALKLAAMAIGDPILALAAEKWTNDQLSSAQGEYVKDGVSRTLRLREGRLYSQRQGGRALALSTASQQRLGFDDDALSSIQLERDAQGKVTALHFYPQGNSKAEVWVRKGDLPAEAAVAALSEEQIARVIGSYTSPGFSTEVRRNGKGGLEVQAKGQPSLEIVPITANKFKLTAVEATLEFETQGKQAQSVNLHQGGRILVLQRVQE